MKICPICSNDHTKPGKTCSKPCFHLYLSQKSKGNGGDRKGAGRSKSGHYKGIYCGSTYELAWVIYNLDHQIEFKRFDGILRSETINYVPDFLQGNKIVEIKGYVTDSVFEKKLVAEAAGYEVEILYKEDLQHCFEWVKTKYQISSFEELYDEFKPKFQIVCNNCGVLFTSSYKKLSCSRRCSMMKNRQSTGTNQFTSRSTSGEVISLSR